MKKKHRRMCSAFWALLLALALVVTPMNSMQAFAEEMKPEVVEEVQPEEVQPEVVAEEEKVVVAEEVTDGPTGDDRLVYGDDNLANEDALVLMLVGDGFTKDEQEKFYEEAEKTADYIMKTSPWDECQDLVKIFAVGVVSNESGARADQAKTQEEADADTRDTYFHTQFWSGGMQRLLALGTGGSTRVNEVKKAHCPSADFNVVMVNTEVYGGSGGSTCVVSLNTETFEMMLHELGHTVGDLSDEYFAGASYANDRQVNMTNNNDPETIKWKKFLGKNGVGIYEHTDGGAGWYKPHQGCKMEYLGQQYPFCEVCKEQLRKSFCQYSNVTKMFFQPYNTIFYETDTAPDMAQYFILRKAKAETTGDQVGDALKLTYYKDGELLSEAPYEAGDYVVKAEFAGNETYGAYSLEVPYTIELKDLITLSAKSKVYDGTPAELDYTVNYDKDYTVEAYYTGTITYSKEASEEYASEDAPIVPGEYKVVLTVKDTETGKTVSKKSADYKINFKTTVLQDNNNEAVYPGAAIYYNNQTIAITGEGFTAEEQDKFEAIAKKYVEYLQNTEPLKETNLYFNYSTVEAVSKDSGISTHNKAKDTYFGLSLDKKGNIVEAEDSAAKATYLGYYQVTAYYKGTIVIVNDDKIREGTLRSPSKMVIYAGADEEGMQFAAQEIVNSLAGYAIGTDWNKDEETKETARIDLLKKIYYYWYGTSYSPVTSRAYDELFVENGTAYDLAPYFHTYVSGKEADVAYNMTYYKNDNGKLGEKLEEAPSQAGEYFALAEFQKKNVTVTIDGTSYRLPFSRGLVPYTITKVREGNPNKPDNPNKPIKPAKPDNPNKPVKENKPDNPNKPQK